MENYTKKDLELCKQVKIYQTCERNNSFVCIFNLIIISLISVVIVFKNNTLFLIIWFIVVEIVLIRYMINHYINIIKSSKLIKKSIRAEQLLLKYLSKNSHK